MASGIFEDVDEFKQAIFDDGHEFESLARPIAEKLIGDDFYPVIGVLENTKLSASFDGITMDDKIVWEHKTLNKRIKDCANDDNLIDGGYFDGAGLPIDYRVQLEQQLMVSGAGFAIFSASKWDGESLVEIVHFEYLPDFKLREEIAKGWDMFEKDLKNHKIKPAIQKAVAEPVESLPALRVDVAGMVTYSDADEFRLWLSGWIEGVNKDPQTDQDFANLQSATKMAKKVEDKIKAVKDAALNQAASIYDLFSVLDSCADMAREFRLSGDKIVKNKKEEIKANLINSAKSELNDYCNAFGLKFMQVPDVNFGLAIKGLSSLASIEDKISTALAGAKIAANGIASAIKANMEIVAKNEQYGYLFADLASLIQKSPEDFANAVAARIEAEKSRIEAENKAKCVEITPKNAEREENKNDVAGNLEEFESFWANELSKCAAPVDGEKITIDFIKRVCEMAFNEGWNKGVEFSH
jgi:predicted phage-related endonuclease